MSDIIENTKNKKLTLKTIKEEYIKRESFRDFSLETLRLFLKKKMRYTYKRIFPQNYRTDENRINSMRNIFLKLISDIIINDCFLIFIDEASFCNNDFRIKLWCSKSKPLKYKFPSRQKSQKLIIAVSKDTIIHYKLSNNTNNVETFAKFIEELKEIIEKDDKLRKLEDNNKIWLYMDNASIHTSQKMKKKFTDSQTKVIFGVPYYPQYNLAEIIFSILKTKFSIDLPYNEYVSYIIFLN